MAVQTMAEIKAHIMARAAGDEDFRTRLIEDPKVAISAELDIVIPDQFSIQVHEENSTNAHLVLPMSDRLTEEELAKAAGGVEVNWDTVNVS